jgi:hypothetical protein
VIGDQVIGEVEAAHTLWMWEGRTVILLTLEDVSELAQLRKLLPVCMSRGRIRNPQRIWQELPLYLKEQADIDVTHGLCATCLEKHYPG